MDYVTDCLIAHFDGIENTGSGHSSSSTSWKDLTGNGYDMSFYGTNFSNNFSWSDNHLTATNNGAITQYLYSASKSYSPTVNFTMECCYKIVSHSNTSYNAMAVYLHADDNSGTYGSLYQGHYMIGRMNSSSYYRCFYCMQSGEYPNYSSSYPQTNVGEITTISFVKPYPYFSSSSGRQIVTYKNGGNKFNNYSYTCYSTSSSGIPKDLKFYVPYYTYSNSVNFVTDIYSIRLYNKQLSDSEVLQNYNVDKKRFNF